jgi:hypothetical protein
MPRTQRGLPRCCLVEKALGHLVELMADVGYRAELMAKAKLEDFSMD